MFGFVAVPVWDEPVTADNTQVGIAIVSLLMSLGLFSIFYVLHSTVLPSDLS